jgi:hypothetical protein
MQDMLFRRFSIGNYSVQKTRSKGLTAELKIEVPFSMLWPAVDAIDATDTDAGHNGDKVIWPL